MELLLLDGGDMRHLLLGNDDVMMVLWNKKN